MIFIVVLYILNNQLNQNILNNQLDFTSTKYQIDTNILEKKHWKEKYR